MNRDQIISQSPPRLRRILSNASQQKPTTDYCPETTFRIYTSQLQGLYESGPSLPKTTDALTQTCSNN